jgi:hypothetical protein
MSQDAKNPQKSSNFVTPLKKEPVVLFGQSVPGKLVEREKPKAPPPPSEMPPPPPPVEGVPPVGKVQDPKPVTPPPTVTPPPAALKPARPPHRTPKPESIRKMPDLNRRAFSVDDEVEAELENLLAGVEADAVYAADSASTRSGGGGGQTKKGKIISIHGDDVFVDIGQGLRRR